MRRPIAILAATGNLFSDFAPYVPAIAPDGTVAFQAALANGRTGVFTDRSGAIAEASARDGEVLRFRSHPAFAGDGALVVHGDLAGGREALLRLADGTTSVLAGPGFDHIGPLGPTAVGDTVAFRGAREGQSSGVFIARGGTVAAMAGPGFTRFHGLPLADPAGSAIFRADCAGGVQVIHGAGRDRVRSGDGLEDIGLFPSLGAGDSLAFTARRTGGGAGVFLEHDGKIRCVLDATSTFESIRGALIDGAGRVVLLAVPRGGRLGVYDGPDSERDSILRIGDVFDGAAIEELALNPVSINARGQLALRLRLAGGRQLVVRADPA